MKKWQLLSHNRLFRPKCRQPRFIFLLQDSHTAKVAKELFCRSNDWRGVHLSHWNKNYHGRRMRLAEWLYMTHNMPIHKATHGNIRPGRSLFFLLLFFCCCCGGSVFVSPIISVLFRCIAFAYIRIIFWDRTWYVATPGVLLFVFSQAQNQCFKRRIQLENANKCGGKEGRKPVIWFLEFFRLATHAPHKFSCAKNIIELRHPCLRRLIPCRNRIEPHVRRIKYSNRKKATVPIIHLVMPYKLIH